MFTNHDLEEPMVRIRYEEDIINGKTIRLYHWEACMWCTPVADRNGYAVTHDGRDTILSRAVGDNIEIHCLTLSVYVYTQDIPNNWLICDHRDFQPIGRCGEVGFLYEVVNHNGQVYMVELEKYTLRELYMYANNIDRFKTLATGRVYMDNEMWIATRHQAAQHGIVCVRDPRVHASGGFSPILLPIEAPARVE